MIIKVMLQWSIIFIAEKLYQKKRAPEERNINPHYPVEIVKFQKDINRHICRFIFFFILIDLPSILFVRFILNNIRSYVRNKKKKHLA